MARNRLFPDVCTDELNDQLRCTQITSPLGYALYGNEAQEAIEVD